MSRYLDPKSDIVFKRIFSDHPLLLKSFLNAVLPLSPDRLIVELSTLPAEQVPKIPILKRTIADVRCIDQLGRAFVVEIQIDWVDAFKQRLLFGVGQTLVKQLEKGEAYELLQPVYGLGLLANIFDTESAEWYHHYKMVNVSKKDEEVLDTIDHLQLVFVELPKFPVSLIEEGKKLRMLWLRFLREINEKTQEVAPELLEVPEISAAINLAEQARYTRLELNLYESYWDQVSRERTLMSDRYNQGKAEGRTEGIEAGKAEGKAEGRMEEKQAIAKNLLERGMTLDEVMRITGLSEAAISALIVK